MPETIVGCPACGTRLKVPPALQGKESIRCPKCQTPVPLRRARAEEIKELPEVLPADEELDELEVLDTVPARTRRRPPPRDDEDDEEERPVRRRRPRDDDDEDYDDRPRRRRRRFEEERPGPWPLALALVPVCALIAFCGGLLTSGTAGLPESKGGADAKFFGLCFMLLVCGVFVAIGVFGVKNRHTYGRFGIEFRGTSAIVVGMIYTVIGGVLGGIAIYGLVFQIFHFLAG
jgi:hypothetical protein